MPLMLPVFFAPRSRHGVVGTMKRRAVTAKAGLARIEHTM